MYLTLGQREMRSVTFTIRAENAVSSLLQTVRRTLERLNPAVGIASMRTVDAQFDDVLRRERLLAALGVAFGVLALLLLAIGLYGMLNAFVVRRTTEIGIRIALGAGRTGVVWMIARETFAVLAVGATLGLVGLTVATSLIQTQLFGIESWDLTAAASAVLALAAVTLIAAWLPTRWATQIEPREALRHDFA
jgi:ABC-type antimicrobial peptide transport system permease subunit